VTDTFELASIFTSAMTRPMVVSDIDGILANWVTAACQAVNAHFGTHYTPMVWWQWHGPFSDEERTWLHDERFSDAAFWMSLAPIDEMITALHTLAIAGYRIVLSSEAPAEQRGARTAWLEYYEVPYNELYLVGAGGKVALCAQASTDNPIVLIDDSPDRWVDCAPYPGVHILCPRTAYTPEMPSESNVTIFDRFNQVPALVSAIG
jgi:hypothetical protein